MTIRSYASIMPSFANKRVGVVGDVMLDIFTRGRVERLSPEAPVPVVLTEEEQRMLGGAANVAAGIRALGGAVDLFGPIGVDSSGMQLAALVQEKGIDEYLHREHGRMTTVKMRVLSGNRHLLRVDWEESRVLSAENYRLEMHAIAERMVTWDALVIADYGKGYITSEFLEPLLKVARQSNIPIIVDTKPKNIDLFKEVSIMTPNAKEAREMVGTEDLEIAGKDLVKRTKSPILITCGGEGMLFFSLDNNLLKIPARQTDVIDISGAGDTVVSVLALALASRASLVDAVHLSNIAASLVVAKPGTATVSDSELFSAL